MSNNNTAAITAQLETALEPTRQSIIDCVRDGDIRRAAYAYEKLEAANWDLKVSHPVNSNSYSWKAQKEVQGFVRFYTANPPNWSGTNLIRVPLTAEEIHAKATQAGERHAEATLKAYAAKLASKITGFAAGEEITSVQYAGSANVWGHSFVTVTLASGKVLNVKTQMIVNVSGLGTVFNQFPTRLVK